MSSKAAKLIAEAEQRTQESKVYRLERKIVELSAQLKREKQVTKNLRGAVETAVLTESAKNKADKAKVKPKPRKKKAAKHKIRLIVPDSHGLHIDVPARDAMLNDMSILPIDEVVYLGDHVDCGGTFSSHQRNYTNEHTESYADDITATNIFLDLVDERAPNAEKHYIYGNHEQHIERWAARNFDSFQDAQWVLDKIGPSAALRLKEREYKWYVQSEKYHNLSIPGAIRLGKCHFVHGISHSRHAAAKHLERFSANVVFGHVHRVQSVGERTVTSSGFGAWCPGTLAKLQPLYRHTAPTSWQHGYGIQFVNESTGSFVHFNVPIHNGVSLMKDVVDAVSNK